MNAPFVCVPLSTAFCLSAGVQADSVSCWCDWCCNKDECTGAY
ncbi:rCG63216, partial [Rattus norvegicus]